MIRDQLSEFCGRNPRRRKRFCYPGAGVDDIKNSVDDFSENASEGCAYVVHVGTNDITKFRSEELIAKYKDLMRRLKNKSKKIIFSGIIPRFGRQSHFRNFHDRAIYINNALKSLCKDEGIGFADNWTNFANRQDLFQQDGVHLNSVGAARLGRLLNNSLSFLAQTD